ncbi:hypothetical protein FB451DRAFT_1549282 [Mycena latifolia]|nr:hypothetical protein FB451DRAFT_1549282 [Mycena latifolia]
MSVKSYHIKRLQAGQSVFSAFPTPSKPQDAPAPIDAMTAPAVGPDEVTLDKFWRRVAELTTRYHGDRKKWIDGSEIRKWNAENRLPCNKCVNSKNSRACVVDEDQPSCRACRANKIGCDRKPRFIFDMTKREFFPSYAQFLAVFQNKEAGRLRRYIKLPRDPPRRARTRQGVEFVTDFSACRLPGGTEDKESLLDKLERLKELMMAEHASSGCRCIEHLQSVFAEEFNARRSGTQTLGAGCSTAGSACTAN